MNTTLKIKSILLLGTVMALVAGAPHSCQAYETIGKHVGGVCSVAYSPDGNWIASGGGDWLVKIWNPSTKSLALQFAGHTSTVASVAYSPDGTMIASGAADNTAKLWSITNRRLLYTMNVGSTVSSVAISPDGQTIATGDYAYNVTLWQLSNGRSIKTLKGHSSRVLSLAFSPDGKTLASGGVDTTIKLWNMASGASNATLRSTLRGHSGEVTSLAFFRDGVLASTALDRSVRLWDVVACSPIGIGLLPSSWSVLGFHSIAVSPDGMKLATGSDDNGYLVWWKRSSYNTVQVAGTLSLNGDDTKSACFSLDSSQLVTGSSDGTVKRCGTYELDSKKTSN